MTTEDPISVITAGKFKCLNRDAQLQYTEPLTDTKGWIGHLRQRFQISVYLSLFLCA